MDYDTYKQSLISLYQKLCEDDELKRIHQKIPLCFSATEWGDCFLDSSPKVLFLGKANNGAIVPKQLDVRELFEGEEAILSNGGGLKWISDTWAMRRENSRWYPKHTPFFRVLRSIAEELCEQYGWEKAKWYQYVAYGNFGKCNIDESPSPSMRIFAGREALFAKMLEVDLEYLRPDFVVCFTGSGKSTRWFSNMFLNRLGAIEGASVEWDGDKRYCLRVYRWKGRYFLVTEHPQRKPEPPHVKTVCRGIEELWKTGHVEGTARDQA